MMKTETFNVTFMDTRNQNSIPRYKIPRLNEAYAGR